MNDQIHPALGAPVFYMNQMDRTVGVQMFQMNHHIDCTQGAHTDDSSVSWAKDAGRVPLLPLPVETLRHRRRW
jgi:hypothetical protein